MRNEASISSHPVTLMKRQHPWILFNNALVHAQHVQICLPYAVSAYRTVSCCLMQTTCRSISDHKITMSKVAVSSNVFSDKSPYLPSSTVGTPRGSLCDHSLPPLNFNVAACLVEIQYGDVASLREDLHLRSQKRRVVARRRQASAENPRSHAGWSVR